MRLFISYSRVDKNVCHEITKFLDAHEVWSDTRIRAGQDWWQSIVEQLKWCEGFIYLLSRESIDSDYCKREAEIALKSEKKVIPVIIRERTQVPEYLTHLQYVDLSHGTNDVNGIVTLLNTLLEYERELRIQEPSDFAQVLADEAKKPPESEIYLGGNNSHGERLPYNLKYKLDQRNASELTQTIYFRWICRFMEDVAGEEKIAPDDRVEYVSSLPVKLLVENLTVAQLKAWLSRVGANKANSVAQQAKAAISTIAEVLADDSLIDQNTRYKIRRLETPAIVKLQDRRLKQSEINSLKGFLLACDTPRDIRDGLIVSLMSVLRINTMVTAIWDNIKEIDGTYYYLSSEDNVLLPETANVLLRKWRALIINQYGEIDPDSPVIRTLSSRYNDKLKETGMSTTNARNVLRKIIEKNAMQQFSPEDLRTSVKRLAENRQPGEMF